MKKKQVQNNKSLSKRGKIWTQWTQTPVAKIGIAKIAKSCPKLRN